MPVPYEPYNVPSQQPKTKGFHLPAREPYAIATERRNHTEALFAFGEYDLFVLMWDLDDLQAGRVVRCLRCATTGGEGSVNSALIFGTYKAPAEDRCPDCFGTTYEGGWKAKIVRPGLWTYTEDETNRDVRGQMDKVNGTLQSTSDFFMRDGDYVFRPDGTRWRVAGAETTRIIDGFGIPSRAANNLAVNQGSAVREDPSSVAYLIPPTSQVELADLLANNTGHFLSDYTGLEEIK